MSTSTDHPSPDSSIRTFCRICEPSCGLVADVDDGRLVALRPDREHPITQGFACRKGLAMVDVHHDPDRLDHPLIRSGDGRWLRASWDEAIAEVVRRLDAVRSANGPDALGAYTGNPLTFNALGRQHIDHFHQLAGITRQFSSGTQDCANKFVASEAVFGTSTVHPIPDLDHTDLCLVIGENPRASQASFYSIPNVLGRMRRRAAEGARFVFINPRRIERPEDGIGDTVQLRPDTDVWFLAAFLHELDRLGGFDDRVLGRHATRVAELRAFIGHWSPERVAPITGMAAETVRELAAAWVATPRASIHASTGLNMGRQGTLAYWLVHMVSFVTGRLDVTGGNLKSDGFYPNATAGVAVTEQMYHDTEFGRLRRGRLPGTLLPDSVLDSDDPIRAMLVWSGNPVLSIPGEQRLVKAFEQLEFLVVVDLYPTATSEYADVILPATDMYERDDVNIANIGTSHHPFAQYTPAVVEPVAERRPEWWIAHQLLSAMELPSVFDDPEPDPWGKWRYLLAKGSDIALDDLRGDEPIVVLDRPEPGTFMDRQVQTADGRIDCCPPAFADAIDRCHELFEETSERLEGGELLLIHKRDAWMHNSWMANVPRMKRGGRTTNPLGLSPADAERLGVVDGDELVVGNEHGQIHAVAEVDDDLMPGVVSMVHGWGHAASPRMRVAHADPGVNPNVVLPSGPGSYEPLSSQAHMTGIPVTVERA